ncbi:MAG: FUSC family protein, partial [Sarcina sp.]
MNIFRGKELYLRSIIYVLAVIVFFTVWTVLGEGTAFVGATISKGALVLLANDLTGNPIRTTITFVGVFVCLGMVSFLASLNIYVGFLINFITIFLLAYNFSSNVKQIIWRPFVLGYLYLLSEPGTVHQLPSRLITLALGGVFVVITQYILNGNRTKKIIYDGLSELTKDIRKKIECLLDKQEIEADRYKVLKNIDKITSAIYKRRIDPFFITKKDNTVINIALYFERLNYLLEELGKNKYADLDEKFLKDLLNLISSINKQVKSRELSYNILELLELFCSKYNNEKENYYVCEILQNINMLRVSIKNSIYDGYRKRDILFNLKLRKQISTVFSLNFNHDSLRFAFGMRIAILISVSYFIVMVFHISEGKWIVFTIYAVVDPLFEDSKKRFSKRFKGTLLGIGIFLLVYIFVPNIILEGIIFITLYYIYVITKDFGIKTMCTAAVSLGLFAIVTNNPAHGVTYRIVFVIIGIAIASLGNKYLFPYNASKSMNKIIYLYQKLSKEILEFMFENPTNDYFYKILGEKVVLSKLYESKL